MVFADFLQTAKVFPGNLIITILSVSILHKKFFVLIKSKTTKFPYIMIISNEPPNYSPL